jgi:non-ribosomal peptide synthetase component E (peptide arylation enzyme)
LSGDSTALRLGITPAVYPAGLLAPSPRTLLDVLDETVRRHPEALALDDGTVRLDYRSLRAEVDRIAADLGRAGVGRGARVGVRVASGTAELYTSILAVLAAGAHTCPSTPTTRTSGPNWSSPRPGWTPSSPAG